ncbi:hypothetical protein K2173_001978 [Erythroxylum novogranatense]|uniref:DUF4378 domain-containing protein n=1 Tax=Erythroxylum novogranatense TaxID=1862640 RepID=A0AAV8SQ73_9ROSI|nr:hypothetical protein K2173_001978 [Erythroxylum novogranatense]
MMAQKHLLHELLKEDQEPFFLKDYIADRRCQLKTASSKTHLQVKKPKPISQSSNFNHKFCRNACLFSLTNSPDPRKSPLFEFQSPAKSPCKSPNAIFLHIPARTGTLLVEAALRIQKQSSAKAKTQNKNNGLGLFGSILRKLKKSNKSRKREITAEGVQVSVKDILRWDSPVGRRKVSKANNEKEVQESSFHVKTASHTSACETNVSCSSYGRASSAIWSESNEDKSLDLDLETPSSSSDQFEEEEELLGNIEFISKDDGFEFASYDNHLCESPFHFVLRRSPSPGRRTPDFSSPATSPCRIGVEGKENQEVESSKKFHAQDAVEEEKEDKEQCSPVSVLDPTFDGHDDQSEDDGFDLDCRYVIVQRTRQQLLRKLRRFEKLAELDPVELEKRMLEQESEADDEDNDFHDEIESESDESVALRMEDEIDRIIIEHLNKSSSHSMKKISRDMKRLVSDLIEEEKREQNRYLDAEVTTVKRVCQRLESWKDVESTTIDMMVEQDFYRELDRWKRYQEQVGEAALEIELGVFGLLVEELTEELDGLTGI